MSAGKMLSPAALLAALGFTARYNSGNQILTSAGLLTLAHGLGRSPILINVWAKCVTAENGYAVGDVVLSAANNSNTTSRLSSVVADAANITIRFASSVSIFLAADKGTGAQVTLTNANWVLVVEAFA